MGGKEKRRASHQASAAFRVESFRIATVAAAGLLLLAAVAFALKPGEFSEVIEEATHFRILNVVERKEGTLLPLNEVRDQVIAAMKEQARTARIAGWIEEAKRELAAERRAREEPEPKIEGDGATDK